MASLFRAALKLLLLFVTVGVGVMGICYQLIVQEIKYSELLEVEMDDVFQGEYPDYHREFAFKVQGQEVRRETMPINTSGIIVWDKQSLSFLPEFETFSAAEEDSFTRLRRIGFFTVEHEFRANDAYFTESIHAGVMGWGIYCWYGATGEPSSFICCDPPSAGDEPGSPAER